MSHQPSVQSISAAYDETYYHSHCGDIPYERSDYWLRFFHGIADQLVRSLKPRSVLDAGCAMGFLVEAMWERGVEAYGIDVSEYAIREVRKDVQPYCRQASLTEPITTRFDLITCIEVLEHIPDEDARAAIRNMASATDTILFSSSPTDLTEPTHVNVRPTISWLHLFAAENFAPDLLYDATFVAPHAILLRRVAEVPPEEVLVLFADLVRYRLTLADRQRTLDHFRNQAAELQSGKTVAETEVLTLNHQLNLLRVERHDQEQEITRLTQQAKDAVEARSQLEAACERQLEQIGELGTRIEEKSAEIVSLEARSDRLSVRLGNAESRLFHVGRQTEEILQSRIWRTLCAAAALLLAPGRIFRSSPSRTDAASPAAVSASGADFLGAACDEPRPNEAEPHTGRIAVRGWALASSGIDRVEVSLAGVVARAEMGEVRPDVARGYPDTPGSRTSGYKAQIDTAAVPDGLHILSIRAFSRAGAMREVQVPVRIDHSAGFASDYDRWVAEFETRNESLIQSKLRSLPLKPLVSVVMPVYRTPVEILRRTIESVRGQSYSNWVLCIADDGSRSPDIERLLGGFAAEDKRIHVEFLETNGGIVHASNAALARAQGDFVALLDHDDELARDALFHMVEAINLQPDVDLLYSDEDKIDRKGRRYDPFFKPDWSPDLLLSENYLCHFLVARRSLVTEAGGFRTGFDGSQDYDLVLRLTGRSQKIAHIPRVLYHWRSLDTSTASFSGQKDYAATAAERAIQGELDRRAISAQVAPGAIPGRWRVRYSLPAPPRVSVIIASGGKVEVLRDNLGSLLGKTEYRNYEVVVIDNSRQAEIQTLVKGWPQPPSSLRYIDWRNRPFNYSVINNEAARHCDSPILLFLNDDTTVITPGWLDAMVELAARPEVGAVGARLLYPDGRIQHAGVVMGLFDNCGHAFKGLAGDRQHYFDLPDVIRNVSAVTGACLMTRAEVFREAGGFDEQTFAVAFNDIDLCLKIGRLGYRVLYTPHALLYHHEAFSKTSRDLVPHPDEVRAMQEKWRDAIAADPFYSPNLTRTAEDYSLRRKG